MIRLRERGTVGVLEPRSSPVSGWRHRTTADSKVATLCQYRDRTSSEALCVATPIHLFNRACHCCAGFSYLWRVTGVRTIPRKDPNRRLDGPQLKLPPYFRMSTKIRRDFSSGRSFTSLNQTGRSLCTARSFADECLVVTFSRTFLDTRRRNTDVGDHLRSMMRLIRQRYGSTRSLQVSTSWISS